MPPTDLPIFQTPDLLITDPGPVMSSATLPSPEVRDHTVLGRDGTEITVRGRMLAYGSSQRDEHSHPVDVNPDPTGDGITVSFAAKSERCSACRWFEVQIFQVDAEITSACNCDQAPIHGVPVHTPDCGLEPPSGRYLVVTAGRTEVPNEVDLRRAAFTNSAYEVVELLVQHRDRGGPFIPQTSARALAHAAAYDANLRDAYLAHTRSGGPYSGSDR